ncbi:MAG: DUF4190 domain-containing protein [Phycisphaerales bacterium]|nr:DUF4190 domain-containing protein [Phycisphaerae bacterium]NNF42031.1 DUF4190 domain-containing protein [Phycisphaerales bacterium]NNM25748.1 DUF4190 domain-containing protein [Phycisphaerales bacterium]
MTQAPLTPVPGGAGLRPHRGAMILVFGILGLLLCVIFGIVAWVMGNGDLRAMQAGEMDPTGEGLVKAGKICGMISVILNLIAVVIWILIVIVGIGAMAGAAGAAGAGGG